MRRLLLDPLLALGLNVFASDTLRVDQQVLSVGDTAVHAIDLRGTPVYKEPVEKVFGPYQGGRWQYSRDQDHVIVVTIIAGKVAAIENHVEAEFADAVERVSGFHQTRSMSCVFVSSSSCSCSVPTRKPPAPCA